MKMRSAGRSAWFTIEEMAKLLKLPTFDELMETFESEAYMDAEETAIEEAAKEHGCFINGLKTLCLECAVKGEEAGLAAEEREQAEIYSRWVSAVELTCEKFFGFHALKFVQCTTERKRHLYRLEPTMIWHEAATKLVETINGVGIFHFSSTMEFFMSGPYTARSAVFRHLHWINDYHRVYGDSSPLTVYAKHMRGR